MGQIIKSIAATNSAVTRDVLVFGLGEDGLLYIWKDKEWQPYSK